MDSPFWDRWLEQRDTGRVRRGTAQVPVCSGVLLLGSTPEEADEELERIISGRRTALILSLPVWQQSGEAVPHIGDYRMVLDGRGDPRAVIRYGQPLIRELREFTSEMALAEGIDTTFDDWKRRTRRRFMEEASRMGTAYSLDISLLYEPFTLVYSESAD